MQAPKTSAVRHLRVPRSRLSTWRTCSASSRTSHVLDEGRKELLELDITNPLCAHKDKLSNAGKYFLISNAWAAHQKVWRGSPLGSRSFIEVGGTAQWEGRPGAGTVINPPDFPFIRVPRQEAYIRFSSAITCVGVSPRTYG
jgi:hypothetical protein